MGEVPIAPYETPGDQRFAQTVTPFLKGHEHHHSEEPRQVSFGKSLEACLLED
ncbi:MAG: hypothetical protein U0936_26110 [Planctomycetaceae bacterium]